jgi:hypothetical protein
MNPATGYGALREFHLFLYFGHLRAWYMGRFIKDNAVLIAGIVLPVLLVGGFMILSHIPKALLDPPRYDFLLAVHNYDQQLHLGYDLSLDVREGRLTGKATPRDGNNYSSNHRTSLFRYKADRDIFEELVFELPENLDELEKPKTFPIAEVQNLGLDKRLQSPDGYTFEYVGYRGGGGLLGALFGSGRRYESSCVLKKESAYFDLPEPMPKMNYYSPNIYFIGWVIDEGNTP